MKWSRFFWAVGFLLIISAGVLVLGRYGVPKWLDGLMLWSLAIDVFIISTVGMFLSILIPAVKQRWWRRQIDVRRVGRRLGAFYYVFWGILLLNFTTYVAISRRAADIDPYLSAPLTELHRLFQAMSTVSMTLIFACFFLMLGISRYVHDEGSRTSGDQ